MYQKTGHFVLQSIIENHIWKMLSVKTRLAYMAYYKSIIKSLYLPIEQIIKQEHI